MELCKFHILWRFIVSGSIEVFKLVSNFTEAFLRYSIFTIVFCITKSLSIVTPFFVHRCDMGILFREKHMRYNNI